MTPIKIHEKFKPLYEQATRYYIITGERGSSKSFTVNLFLTQLSLTDNNNILFTRYTLESAKDSIIPEFKEKIELLGLSSVFDVQINNIYSRVSNSKIIFRGIKTSQGIQTAKLKSLTDINIWVIDEAEELPDEDTFEIINKSIRSKKAKNMIILILNPAYKNHWIYKRFFEGKIPDGFNGVMDGITYIHMLLEDNIQNLDKEYVKDILQLKEKDFEKYKKAIASTWKDDDDEIVFSIGKLKRFDTVDYSNAVIIGYCDVSDQGTDFTCFLIGALIGENVFILDLVHTRKDSNYTIPKIISLLDKYNVSTAYFESNGPGLMYTKLLKTEYKGKCKIVAYPNSINKHSRIVVQADYILDYFHFKNVDRNSEYYQYLDQLTAYRNDKKSLHDDAPDATAGLSLRIRLIK